MQNVPLGLDKTRIGREANSEKLHLQLSGYGLGSQTPSHLPPRILWHATIWLAILVVFLALAWRASTARVAGPDVTLSRFIQGFPAWFCSPVATVSNTLGYGLPLTALALVLIVLFLCQQQRLLALGMLLTFGVRWSDVAVKAIVAEPRPNPTLIRAHEHLTDGSFPSGHVVGTGVVLGLLLIALPLLRMPAALRIVATALTVFLIASVGLARVWVGAHWPSDVLGGYLFAAIFLLPTVGLSLFKGRASHQASGG